MSDGVERNPERAALRDQLRELVRAHSDALSPEEVAGLLAEYAREVLEEAPGSGELEGFGEALRAGGGAGLQLLTDAAIPEVQQAGEGPRYVLLKAETPREVAVLLHQALEVGAVVIKMDSAPALNELIHVELRLVDAQFSIRTQGRVVHTSAEGCAVEVAGIEREDRAALTTILQEHRAEVEAARMGALADKPMPPPADSAPSSETTKPGAPAGAARALGAATPPRPARPDPARTLFGAPNPRPAQPVGSIFSRQKKPSTSVTLGALNRLGEVEDFSARREVELIDPDLRVLTSSGRMAMPSWSDVVEELDSDELALPAGEQPDLRDTSTTYGREAIWVEPVLPPARVEELDGERILDVLLQLSGSGFTGLLEVEEGEVSRQVYFDGGLVVEIVRRPRVSGEELGPMLHMADRIDAEQLGMAAAHSDENHTIFERSLLELELLDQAQIRQAIAGRLTYLLRLICQAERGVVRVYDGQGMPAGYLPAPPLRVHVPVERIIYRRLFERLKNLSAEQRDALVQGFLDTYPQMTPDGFERVERVVLNDAHARLVNRILRARRRLREVFTESSLAPAETAAVVHALYRMGVLKFDTSLHKTIVRERFRENVTVKYLSVHKASFFEVLNVHWSSYDEVIEKAYRELAAQFNPQAVPDSIEPEVLQRVREIHERVEAAYRALKRHEDRSLYRGRIMPEYKLDHAIPLFLKQAELAERRQEWAEAKDSLRRLLEIDPENQQAASRLAQVERRLAGGLSEDPAESNF